MPTDVRRDRRAQGRLRTTQVHAVERVTPRMVRVRFADDLADWQDNGTDQHAGLYFLDADALHPEPLTLEWAREHWLELCPRIRRYTIRRHHAAEAMVDMDVVLHGDSGPASAWAEEVKPGDRLTWFGPTPAYALDTDADWHLLAGDETALPAIAAIVEELPAGSRARAYVEVADAAERQHDIETEADVEITWVCRDGVEAGRSHRLVEAVTAAELPPGRTRVWAGGERDAMRAMRRAWLAAGLPRSDVHATAYWTYGEGQDAKAERDMYRRARDAAERRARGLQAAVHHPSLDG